MKETAALIRSLNFEDKISYQDWLSFLLPARKRCIGKRLLQRVSTEQASEQ